MDTEENKPTGNNSKLIVAGIILVVVIGGGAWFLSQKSEKSEMQPTQNTTVTTKPEDKKMDMTVTPDNGFTKTQEAVMTVDEKGTKVFTIEAKNFSFSVKDINLKKGDKVKIVLVNKQGFHDWVSDEFNARTKQIQANSTDEVEFTADKVGKSEYYCSVGNHRQMGMWGNLIVEE